MSIIADALHRLQMSRATTHPVQQATTEAGASAVTASSRIASRWGIVLVVTLSMGTGTGAYWWGHALVPEAPAVSESPGASVRHSLDTATPHDPAPLPEPASNEPLNEKLPTPDMPLPRPAEQDPAVKAEDTPIEEAKRPTSQEPKAASRPTMKPPPDRTSEFSVTRTYALAQKFIRERRYRKAETVLRPVFRSPPEDWEPWYLMGTARLALGHLEEAEHYLMEGLARNGTALQLWVLRALLAQQRGNHKLALDALSQAAFLDPESPEVQLNIGYSLEFQGQMRRATEHYHVFLALTEEKPAYHAIRKKVLSRVMRFTSS